MKKTISRIIYCPHTSILTLVIICAFTLQGFSQQIISNVDFVSAGAPLQVNSYPLNITTTCSSTESWVTNTNGVPTGSLAFTTNASSNGSFEITTNAGSPTYLEITLSGADFHYFKTHKLYFQLRQTNTSTISMSLSYKTDPDASALFTTYTPSLSIGTSSYNENLIDLSSFTALDNVDNLILRFTPSGIPSGGSWALSMDNFQLQGTKVQNPAEKVQRALFVSNFFSYCTDFFPPNFYKVDQYYSTLCAGLFLTADNLYTKEKELLEYCIKTHTTHLILYDLPKIFSIGHDMYDPHNNEDIYENLCRFMQIAKQNYCIETFSAAVSDEEQVTKTITLIQPLALTQQERNKVSDLDLISGIETVDSLILDPNIKELIQPIRLAIIVERLNNSGAGCPDFDYFTTEKEYWNGGGFNQFKVLVNKMRQVSNIPVEGYTARFLATGTPATDIANYYDGTSSSFKMIDRTLAVQYRPTASDNENPFTAWSWLREINDNLKVSTTTDKSIIVPLFSGESDLLSPNSSKPNNNGVFLSDPVNSGSGIDPIISRNIFSVEKYFYDDWRSNSLCGTDLTLNSENVVKPGSSTWIGSFEMVRDFNDPVIFYRTDNVDVCSTGLVDLEFKYCGPVDPGTKYTFTLSNSDISYSYSSGQVTIGNIESHNFSISPRSEITPPIVVSGVPFGTTNVSFIATMVLEYPQCGTYTYSQKVDLVDYLTVKSVGSIDESNPSHNMCQGSVATLFANYTDPSATITWYKADPADPDPSLPAGTGPYYTIPLTINAGVYYYYYVVSSSSSCTKTTSVDYKVTVLANPQIDGINFDCDVVPITLSATSAYSGATFNWSDGFIGSFRDLPLSDILSVKVQNEGGCYRVANTLIPDRPSLTISAPSSGCLYNVSVNNPPYGATYKWKKLDPITHEWALIGSGTIFSNRPTGEYCCIVTVNGICNYRIFNLGIAVQAVDIVHPMCGSPNAGSITIVVDPNSVSGTVNYSWTGSSSTSETASGLLPGNYTCNITNGTTCPIIITAQVLGVGPCENQQIHLCDQENISSAPYFPGATMAIHGEVYIDQPTTLNGSDIKFDEGARLTVKSGVNLTLVNCTLSACSLSWHGIVLQDGSSSIYTNSNTIIKDAEIAITAINGAELNITESQFLNDNKGIFLSNGNFSTSVFKGNIFDFGNTDPKATTAFAHIILENLSGITIGDNTSVANANIFTHSYYGIKSFNSNCVVQNNEFSNIGTLMQDDAHNWVTYGYGFYSEGSAAQTEIKGTGVVGDQNYFHDIEACCIWIDGNSSTSIYGNSFNNINAGIELFKVGGNIINIHDNNFVDFYQGISGTSVSGASIDITFNKFNMEVCDAIPTSSKALDYRTQKRYALIAVDIQNTFTQTVNHYYCANNWLANSTYGIHTRNVESVNLNDVSILDNQIYFTKTADKMAGINRGIWLENCLQNTVQNNHIRAYNSVAPETDFSLHLVGIDFSRSTDCQITENYIEKMGRSISGSFTCSGSELHCNNFHDFNSGFYCNKITIGEQGDAGIGEYWKNEWQGAMTGQYRIEGSPAFPIRWVYTGNGSTYDPNPYQQDIIPDNNGTVPDGCTTPDITTPSILREKKYEKTIYGENHYLEDSLFHQYYEKIIFYTGLSKNPSLLNLGTSEDILYQALYNNLMNSNIGKFATIDDLIRSKDYSQANGIIDQVIEENIVEYYKKTVSKIIVDKELGNRELTPDEKSTLESIAFESGMYGGESVYIARAILRIFVDEDNSTSRKKAPDFYTKGKSAKTNIIQKQYLYPNPSNEKGICSFPKNGEDRKLIRVTDVYGKIVKSLIWVENQELFSFNVTDLLPGLYNFTIFVKDEAVHSEKLVVIH
jgi:uncharacterized protein affecting Mg2+/Co2+ transport